MGSITVRNARGRLARPWPERPVSAANKSGKHNAASRHGITYSCAFSDAGGGEGLVDQL